MNILYGEVDHLLYCVEEAYRIEVPTVISGFLMMSNVLCLSDAYPLRARGFAPGYLMGFVLLNFLVFCVVFFVLFVFVLCLGYPMLPVFPYCPFLIVNDIILYTEPFRLQSGTLKHANENNYVAPLTGMKYLVDVV